jgi:hypothetical protein
MRITLLFSLLSVFTLSHAHEDIIQTTNVENVHLNLITGYSNYEVYKQADILHYLAVRLLKAKGFREHVYISFRHAYTGPDSSFYALAYVPFHYPDETNSTGQHTHMTGLKLVVRDVYMDIGKMLRLINAGISNIESIKASQSTYYLKGIMPRDLDTVVAIPAAGINKLLTVTDTTIERILGEKTYRNIIREKEYGKVDYYFQNNCYHFFNEDEAYSDTEGKDIEGPYYGQVQLIVDNIFEIIGGLNDNHIIFTSDRTFYYLPSEILYISDPKPPRPLRGPFTIDSISPSGRRPIFKYTREYNDPFSFFTLYIRNFTHDINLRDSKVLFLPDSNLLISNYENFENEMLLDFFKKTELKEDKAEPKDRLMLVSAALLLAISLLLNIRFWLQQSRSNT